jgi:hypothetical protein
MSAVDLYLDAEWFIGGDVFLLGWARNSKEAGQLYDHTLTEDKLQDLLHNTTGRIYFYGPDIGILEKHFNIDIRNNYHCVNLYKVFKDALPGLKNYKLATLEKLYGLTRNRNEYKANIFSIFQDWRRPHVKSLVLQYNREDVVNLYKLKEMIFVQKDIADDYLLQCRLAGTLEIIQNHVYLLPCDIYRGGSFGKYTGDADPGYPNITAQMVVGAKFFDDKVSRYRMSVLMYDVVKNMRFDLVTSVNGRDSKFDLAAYLAKNIAMRLKVPYEDLFSNHNNTCSPVVKNKTVLIIDDVIYKGRTMRTAIESCSIKGPQKIYFLAFGKSQRFAF